MANSIVYLQAWFAYRSIAGQVVVYPTDPPLSITKTANVRMDYCATSTSFGQPDQNIHVSNPVPTTYPWQAGYPEFNYCWLYAVVLYEVVNIWGQPGSCSLTVDGVGSWTASTTGAARDIALYVDTDAGLATHLPLVEGDPSPSGLNLWPTITVAAVGDAVPPAHVITGDITGSGAVTVSIEGGADEPAIGASFYPGDTLAFTATPIAGWHTESMVITPSPYSPAPDSDVDVQAVFEENPPPPPRYILVTYT